MGRSRSPGRIFVDSGVTFSAAIATAAMIETKAEVKKECENITPLTGGVQQVSRADEAAAAASSAKEPLACRESERLAGHGCRDVSPCVVKTGRVTKYRYRPRTHGPVTKYQGDNKTSERQFALSCLEALYQNPSISPLFTQDS